MVCPGMEREGGKLGDWCGGIWNGRRHLMNSLQRFIPIAPLGSSTDVALE